MKVLLFALVSLFPGRSPDVKSFECEMSPRFEEHLYNEPEIVRVGKKICIPYRPVCKCINSLQEPTQCSWLYTCVKDTDYARQELDDI